MSRAFQPCRCKYQMEQPWGYSIFRRSDATYWHEEDKGSTTGEAIAKAEQFTTVLIVCRGCGAEMIREYDNPKN